MQPLHPGNSETLATLGAKSNKRCDRLKYQIKFIVQIHPIVFTAKSTVLGIRFLSNQSQEFLYGSHLYRGLDLASSGARSGEPRARRSRTAHGRVKPGLNESTGLSPLVQPSPLRAEPSPELEISTLNVFGLWRVCFPPGLCRTARRLPVEALR